MEIDTFRAMNTGIVLMAETEARDALEAFAEARTFIEASEQRFTRFSQESELSTLNRSAGTWFHASPELFEVVAEALSCFHRTGGLFDPAILPDLELAGYDRSMDEIRMHGAALQAAQKASSHRMDFESVELQTAAHLIRLPGGMRIDLGGIAKGWIAEQAAHLLHKYAAACAANAGGDMYMIGYPSGEDAWEVVLEDPHEPGVDLAILRAREGAIATSSVVKRVWKQGEAQRHHLIDPRTGVPAQTRWLSVTVMAGHAAEAEAFAKAFLIAGTAETARLNRQNPGLTVVAVDAAGRLHNLSAQEETTNAAQ
ncbi:MAG: FAD:protein FMN transferase [Bacteroidota bacterium]